MKKSILVLSLVCFIFMISACSNEQQELEEEIVATPELNISDKLIGYWNNTNLDYSNKYFSVEIDSESKYLYTESMYETGAGTYYEYVKTNELSENKYEIELIGHNVGVEEEFTHTIEIELIDKETILLNNEEYKYVGTTFDEGYNSYTQLMENNKPVIETIDINSKLMGYWNEDDGNLFFGVVKEEDGSISYISGLYDAGGSMPGKYVNYKDLGNNIYEIELFYEAIEESPLNEACDAYTSYLTVEIISDNDEVIINNINYYYKGQTFDDGYQAYQQYLHHN